MTESKHKWLPLVFDESNQGRDSHVGYGIYTEGCGHTVVHVPITRGVLGCPENVAHDAKEFSEYLVQCCNAYPQLVEALKEAQHALTVTHNVLATDRPDKAAFAVDCAWTTDFTKELAAIEAALRSAGEEL